MVPSRGEFELKRITGIIGENSIEFVKTLLKCLDQGLTVALVDWRIPIDVALSMLIENGITECYIERGKYKNIMATYGIKLIYFSEGQKRAQTVPEWIYTRYEEIFSNNSVEDAIVFFSSGTTGGKKGIRLSFFAINKNVDSIIDYMQPSQEDTILITKSFAHSSTVVGELFVGLKTHAKIIIAPTILAPTTVIELLQRYNVSIWCINPTLLKLYAMQNSRSMIELRTLRKIYVSGSIAEKKVIIDAKKSFPHSEILNVYGLTEAGPRVSAQRPQSEIGSVGMPIKGVKIKVMASYGVEAHKTEIGIIHVYTPSIMNGYLIGEIRPPLVDGWLNTGDLGYVGENGELFIVGRCDNMIQHGAHNVFPEEIEQVIKLHPYISDCVVFGARHEFYGEEIICLYVSKSMYTESMNLRLHCAEHLAPYEIPHKFVQVEALPYNSNGKIMRNEAKRILMQENSNDKIQC